MDMMISWELRWSIWIIMDTLPEKKNSKFAPEDGWLEYEGRFLLVGSDPFAGSFRECIYLDL